MIRRPIVIFRTEPSTTRQSEAKNLGSIKRVLSRSFATLCSALDDKFALVILLFLLPGCEHRPLMDSDKTAYLKIRLVTDSINNVTCNIYNEQLERPVITSDIMRVFVYDGGGAPLLSQGFTKEKSIDAQGYEVLSGPLQIIPGDYRLVSYNFDVEDTFISHENDYSTIRAYTNEIPSAIYTRLGARAKSLGPVYYEPEHLMVAREPDLEIGGHYGVKTIELDARTVVDTYYIQIRISGAENMAAKAAGLAVLSGLSQSSLIGEGVPAQEPASVYFEMKRGKDHRLDGENQDVLCAVFNTFGRLEDVASDLKITLSVLARNGETHQKEIDMTPIFQTEDARLRHWLLIDEVWEIPAPVDEGGGFTPKVDDWEDIEEIIPI
ncbi:MAG: DUF5119 domain-containing protein [Bacteroides sp.]|nr:DUF5119 domain-containing protein [Bacteroides sp.]